ncbi:MAG: bile acid:sodium symporter [Methanomicrobiales archaeon]|nr:bile acid:sodium symporter [Methanomicrobiales archaeon]
MDYPILYNIGTIAVYLFIVTSMLLTGLLVSFRELMAPVRNRRVLTLSLFANFVAVPLLAFALIALIPAMRLPENADLAAGLILIAIAAGAPSTAKVAQFTGGNIAQAVSMTIILTIVTVFLMPFLLPLILPGAQGKMGSVFANLVVLVLIPIVLGMLLKTRSEPLAARLRPIMDWVSNISIAVIFLTFGLIFLSRIREIAGSPSGALAIVVAIVFTLGALAITYLIGGLAKESRQEITFGAGFRNATAALVVVFASFSSVQNDALLMVLMVTIFAIIITTIIVGIIFKKRMDAEKRAKGSGA